MELTKFSFDPFPMLKGKNILLTPISLEDAPDMLKLRSDERVMQYIPRKRSTTMEEIIAFLEMVLSFEKEGNQITWGIRTPHSNELMGTIGYYRIQWENGRGEVGYALRPEFHRKGIMKEALELVLNYGFNDVGFHSVEGVVDPANTASAQLLISAGFVQEGHISENCYWEGKFLDSVIYSLLARNYQAQ